MDLNNSMQTEEDMRCMKISTQRAHQQVITVLDSDHGHVITGSQDHILKVYRYVCTHLCKHGLLFLRIIRFICICYLFLFSLEDQRLEYTFHGHSGPISCLFIDRISSSTFGSGSQDGSLCVWDLNGTGNISINPKTPDLRNTRFTRIIKSNISLLCVRNMRV